MEVCVRVAGLGGASHTAVSVEPLGGAAAAVAGLAGDGLARGRLLRRMSEHRRQIVSAEGGTYGGADGAGVDEALDGRGARAGRGDRCGLSSGGRGGIVVGAEAALGVRGARRLGGGEGREGGEEEEEERTHALGGCVKMSSASKRVCAKNGSAAGTANNKAMPRGAIIRSAGLSEGGSVAHVRH